MPNAGPTVQAVALVQAFTESSFAADMSASLASFTAIPFMEAPGAAVTLTRELHDPMHAVQYHHDYREEVLGKKACALTFTLPLAPTGVAAVAATAAVQSALGLLLSKTMGGEDLGAGSTAGAWSSAKTGAVATAGAFEKGAAIGWVNTAGLLEARPLANKVTSTLTTKLAFSATPATASVIYGSATYYLASDPDGSFNFAVRGLESDDSWLLLGCQLESLTVTLPLDGTIPTAAFAFKGVNWLHEDDTAAGDFADIAPVTYSNTSPITGQTGRFMARTLTTQAFTAGVTVNVSSVAFEPQIKYQPITSPSGTNGVFRWRLSRNNGPSIQGSFSTFFETTKWLAHRDNRDDFLLLYQIGSEAGKTMLLEAATCQIVDAQRVDDGGIAGQAVTWKGRRDATIATATTDLTRSPFRIHFL